VDGIHCLPSVLRVPFSALILLLFVWVVHDAKCILVTCVCVCVSVCLSLAAFQHYCTDPDVTWGNGRRCPLVVHYWADLQSVHGFHCYDSMVRTRNISECLYSLYAWLVEWCERHLFCKMPSHYYRIVFFGDPVKQRVTAEKKCG